MVSSVRNRTDAGRRRRQLCGTMASGISNRLLDDSSDRPVTQFRRVEAELQLPERTLQKFRLVRLQHGVIPDKAHCRIMVGLPSPLK
jgi:hypothetical protein